MPSSSSAVQCGELEVEIYKLRRQVERARNVDQRHSHNDNVIASELQALRDEVAKLEGEYDDVAADDMKIQAELGILNRNLQEQISARDQHSIDIDALQSEADRYEMETLRQTAEMEQLKFYQQEMDAMVQKLRMNVQYSVLEKEQDEIRVRKLRERVEVVKEEIHSQNELQNVMLKPQLDVILREKNEMKFKAQTLSFTNDELQEEMEQLGGWGAQDNFAMIFGTRMKKGSTHSLSIHSAAGSLTGVARSVVDQMVKKRVDRASGTVASFDDRDTCTTVDELEQPHQDDDQYLNGVPKVVRVDTDDRLGVVS
uniref:Uncharacterized protein n=1 Tax=Helicotheca tamesis TaxID=374047 RepID=A0A7S2IGG0_9STRA|mmetsp:Transcript_9148/g.12713  ORF Transcript_9148/g.12713 Transcript_9148/m.12713 type:complete len:313 (+) Transcript_9148:380-1318(+)|eukprot:CAMPEP_0185730884 /NCGR_PEP_ID=MMETSP1171-20130828/11283_1 /TAXON_ID=374046 /ORGANISM="Helicotheca tamensis, Strain CCMP826" /LENGTH=312 /DNA_ID=CAMNT_0028400029 /DNA_START=269 /DNA_END=1207 /DNA_ORIENTATION=-